MWEVGDYVEAGEVYPLDIYFYDIFKDAGFHLRNRIIWHFEHGLHASKRFSGRYETILWLTKSHKYTFNLDDIRVPSKYPGKTHYKGAKRGQPSGNPLGKNPSDFWNVVTSDWEKEIWDVPNVKANHPEKTIHPCQFPIELIQRCVLALTDQGDLVLDPFLGVIRISGNFWTRLCLRSQVYGLVAGTTCGVGAAGAQATAQSERIKP